MNARLLEPAVNPRSLNSIFGLSNRPMAFVRWQGPMSGGCFQADRAPRQIVFGRARHSRTLIQVAARECPGVSTQDQQARFWGGTEPSVTHTLGMPGAVMGRHPLGFLYALSKRLCNRCVGLGNGDTCDLSGTLAIPTSTIATFSNMVANFLRLRQPRQLFEFALTLCHGQTIHRLRTSTSYLT